MIETKGANSDGPVGYTADLLRSYEAEHREVLLRLLRIDHDYQRPLRVHKVERLLRDFNEVVAGQLIVSERPDGLYLVDGQHRWHALQKLGLTHWYAYVVRGISPIEEAKIWQAANTVRATPLAVELFRTRLYTKDPIATEIARIVEAAGFRLELLAGRGAQSRQLSGRVIAAVAALDRVFRSGGSTGLTQTLTVIAAAWPEDQVQAAAGTVIWGLHVFLAHAKWKQEYDVQRLIAQLSKITPARLLRDVNAMTQTLGRSPALVFAEYVARYYNKGLRSGRLSIDA
jgi:hypothetical protein